MVLVKLNTKSLKNYSRKEEDDDTCQVSVYFQHIRVSMVVVYLPEICIRIWIFCVSIVVHPAEGWVTSLCLSVLSSCIVLIEQDWFISFFSYQFYSLNVFHWLLFVQYVFNM